MILMANPDYRLNMPLSVLPLLEKDPRTTDDSEFLDLLRQYISESAKSLREAQMKALDIDFVPLDSQLDSLQKLDEGWDGYGAPVPTTESVNEAREVLKRLHDELIKPYRISPSADGGVAFSFKASGDRRAQIEILNSGEKFAHLYDLKGNSYTHEWPETYKDEPFGMLLKPILNYMRL